MSTRVHLIAEGRVYPLSADQQRMIDHVAELTTGGVPRLADLCTFLGWDLQRGRRTMAELEELGLVAVVPVEVGTRRLNRQCNRCLHQLGIDAAPPATYVAVGASGLNWLECGEHDEQDNEAGELRTGREPIADWFSRYGLELEE
jgi:hypothetical protein